MFFEEGKLGSVPYFFAGLGAFIGCIISFSTMLGHLKNYRRPDLQRLAFRILWMVPVYAVASFVALSSRNAADYIDTIRDIYEGFVIYSFFLLCINYLGGERSLLAMLDERMRIHHLWPFNLFFAPMDMSDPDTFLFVRRGVLQFVILKPILSLFTMVLKLTDSYHEGDISWGSAYLWIAALYNLSVCWSLYCLVLFYVQCSKDLKPYRPMPKFVCVKSIVFLTFYQGLGVAFLVWAGVIHDSEGYTSSHFASVLQDFLICLEMPALAMLHRYAFPWTDYNDLRLSSRVPLLYAVRDACGVKDIIQDTLHTFKGTTFRTASRHAGRIARTEDGEPLMGRRVLRQSSGKSYGTLATPDSFPDDTTSSSSSSDESNTSSPKSSRPPRSSKIRKDRKRPIVRTSLAFGSPEDDPRTEAQYAQARTLPYGDYNYPVVHEDERFRYPPNIQAEIDRQARDYLSRSQARILSHQSSAASIGSAGVNTSTRNSSPDLTFEPA